MLLRPCPVPDDRLVLPLDLVRISAAMSLDGCIDGCSPERLVLSSVEDCRAVHALRAEADAILVGAGTVRRDDPQLTVRIPALVAQRRHAGLPEQPLKVVLAGRGDLDPGGTFFRVGGDRLVLCPDDRVAPCTARLGGVARVVGLPAPDAPSVLHALAGLGVRRLLVEGGSRVLAMFLAAGCFHQLRLAVAPFFVGRPDAPRFAGPAEYLHGPGRRLRLTGTSNLGNVAVLDLVNDAVAPPRA